MAGIGVVATLKVAEGKNTEFEAIFADMTAGVRAHEPGNLYYTLVRSRTDPQLYRVLEAYVDQAALEAHGASDHFRTGGKALAASGCLSAAPDVEYLDVV